MPAHCVCAYHRFFHSFVSSPDKKDHAPAAAAAIAKNECRYKKIVPDEILGNNRATHSMSPAT
jgi:hypothetical protein